MSARANVYQIRDRRVNGGVSPNAYVPKVTAEVRVHYPPVDKANIAAAIDELDRAYDAARNELRARWRAENERVSSSGSGGRVSPSIH